MAMRVGHLLKADPSIVAVSFSSNADDATLPGWPERDRNRRAITEMIARRPVQWVGPNLNRSRSEVIRSLPAELLRMAHFCREPIGRAGGCGYDPCGKCPSCMGTPHHLTADA